MAAWSRVEGVDVVEESGKSGGQDSGGQRGKVEGTNTNTKNREDAAADPLLRDK
jgi:hypothetical protein